MQSPYDVVIIGGGPAGLAATLYCSRRGLQVAIVEARDSLGGSLRYLYPSKIVEDYLGFPAIKAIELAQHFEEHLRKLGNVDIYLGHRIIDYELRGDVKFVRSLRGLELEARAIIVCIGASPIKLLVPGCDLPGVLTGFPKSLSRFRNRRVVVIGGGNAALEAAIALSEVCSEVYLVHRRTEFRADEVLVERAKKLPIHFVLGYVPTEIFGREHVEGIKLKSVITGEEKQLECNFVIFAVGVRPETEVLKERGLDVDDRGFIKVDSQCRTNIPGVFAAGDVTGGLGGLMTIHTAIAQGFIAARSAYIYLEKPYWARE
ncbi:MAG: thioredoxin-disulfide reductase [Thermoprotei archaeon]|nr:MAG: thioredoxin-disulfide reductase [Thermoprotei archaeon]